MSRRVLWHRRAIADLLNVADWQTAARIDAEVLYFAESGRGTVKRVRSENGPDELRLYAAPPYFPPTTKAKSAVKPGTTSKKAPAKKARR